MWESFGLNSLKPSLAPPYPPTLIATPHCLYWEGCAFPGQTRPSVTGLLPSSSSEFGLYPSPALALQVGSLPITNLLQRSPEDSKSHNSSQNKTMHFLSGYVVWAILSICCVVLTQLIQMPVCSFTSHNVFLQCKSCNTESWMLQS